jgi:hypothetical protein
MTYDKNFYDSKRQKVQEKFGKAQQKWIGMCEMADKEYISFQERIQELNAELAEIAKEEEVSKKK